MLRAGGGKPGVVVPFLEQPTLQRSYGPTVLSKRAVVRLKAAPLTADQQALVLSRWTEVRTALADALDEAGVETRLLTAPMDPPASPEATHLTVSLLLARSAACLMATAAAPWYDFGAVDSSSAEVLAFWNDWMEGVGVTAGQQALHLLDLAFIQPADLKEASLAALAAVYAARIDSFNYPMVRSAEARGIPWRAVRPGSRILAFGQGARQQWFHGTMSNTQSRAAVHLTTRKHLSIGLLRAAGLPVPDHGVVRSREEAEAVAEKLGFPVVVKPDSGSRAVGIFLNLPDRDAVAAAFDSCAALAQRVLVEKHHPGLPYRITVCDGKAYSTLRHALPVVLGDGTTTVRGLIEQLNLDRHRAVPDDYRLPGAFPVAEKAEEIEARLREQGLALDDVPVAGREVFLTFLPTLSGGGAHFDVSDKVHPATLELAEEASRVLHAKHLGFDLITADISRPHEEVPLVFNEANAAPGIRSHSVVAGPPRDLQDVLLSPFFPDGDSGRIPIALALGPEAQDFAGLAERLLAESGRVAGYADSGLARIGDYRLRPLEGGAAHPGGALLRDKRLEIAVMCCLQEDLIGRGLPSDRPDAVLLPGLSNESRESEVTVAVIRATVTLPGTWLVLPGNTEIAWLRDFANHRRLILVGGTPDADKSDLPGAIHIAAEGAGPTRRLVAHRDGRQDPLGRLTTGGADDSTAAWAAAMLLGLGLDPLEIARLVSRQTTAGAVPATMAEA